MTRKHLRVLARANILPINPNLFAPRGRRKTAADRLVEDGWVYNCDHPEVGVRVYTRDEEVSVPRSLAIRRYFCGMPQHWHGKVTLRRYAWVYSHLDIVEHKGQEYFPAPGTIRT